MRQLLSTSALIAPFLVSAALAQDATPAPAPTAPPVVGQPETTPGTDSGTQTDTGIETDTDVDTDTGIDTDTGVDTDVDTDIGTDTDTGIETDTDIGADTDTGIDTDTAPAPGAAVDGAAAPAPGAAAGGQTTGETIVQQQDANELRVDWITGTTVRSRQDESIGTIRDLIIDQETNTITAAILSVGGFLGIGGKQIAVRFDELEIDFDAREIQLDLTREEADAAPEYVFRDRTEAPAPAVGNGMGAPVAPID